MRRALLAWAAVAIAGLALWLASLTRILESQRLAAPEVEPGTAMVERGAYWAQVGHCSGCHTRPGGEPLAGGRTLETAFGAFETPNITSHEVAGIGDWSPSAFRRALLAGRRADGRPLYPACPYPSFTHARPADVDALYAYLQSTEPVGEQTGDHELVLPFQMRSLLYLWQWAFFERGGLDPVAERGGDWHRGRYLVEGLGHCSACHKQRNAFGATREAASAPGGHVDGWYAPSLHSADEAGLQAMSVDAGARLLGAGAGADHVMLGPMAAVVFDSLQHLSHDDARAMATYLHELPEVTVEGRRGPIRPGEAALERQMIAGDRLYARHCADCHGDAGAGSDGVVALAGNRAVTQADPTNVVRIIRKGGFPAATEGNPYPHGMPPFPQLNDGEVAALTSYIRNSWGNNAAPITAVDGAQ